MRIQHKNNIELREVYMDHYDDSNLINILYGECILK